MRKNENELRLKLVRDGLSNKEVADICGCSAAAISSWKIRRGFTNSNTLSDAEIARRIELFEQGYKFSEIAVMLGKSEQYINDWYHGRGMYRDRGAVKRMPDREAAKARRRNTKALVKDVLIADKKGWSYGEYSSERAGRPVRHKKYPKPEFKPIEVKI